MRRTPGIVFALVSACAGCAGAPATGPSGTPEPPARAAPSAAAPAAGPAQQAPPPTPGPVELRRAGFAAYDALDFRACADHFKKAADAAEDDASRADDLYGAACCASLGGAAEEALGYLQRAVAAGYPALGFDHPALAELEPSFVEKVPAHLDELAATLRRDKDPKNRAAAAFLLAYATEPAQAVERLTPSIRDPASLVRNNVLRVLGALQKGADRPLLDLAKVVDAVGLPETTDRNKALYVLMGLLEKTPPKDRAAQRGAIVRQAGAELVAMASLRQPNNRDHARGVLELLSGEKHEDTKDWEKWLARQKKK